MKNYTPVELDIIKKVSETLVNAGSTFSDDKKNIYAKAISKEVNKHAKWVLENILENANVAEKNKSPLCDDTGIPHLVIELGPEKSIDFKLIQLIKEGVADGLIRLPGRPMAIKGNDIERLNQSGGLSVSGSDVLPAPILLRETPEDVLRLHIAMMGGGPAIRGKTYRIFHKHDENVIINEIISWSKDAIKQLGCTPCTLAIGIGRSQFEANALMLEALIDGNYEKQRHIETVITEGVNESCVGPLGLGGSMSVMGTFLKVGEQRASGVRVVCLSPCCCFEPRVASVEL